MEVFPKITFVVVVNDCTRFVWGSSKLFEFLSGEVLPADIIQTYNQMYIYFKDVSSV
jgi:hypothetical protein